MRVTEGALACVRAEGRAAVGPGVAGRGERRGMEASPGSLVAPFPHFCERLSTSVCFNLRAGMRLDLPALADALGADPASSWWADAVVALHPGW